MTEESTVQWGDLDIQEDITKEEQAASNDISITSPVGQFVCLITKCNPVEKTFNTYSCHAASLEMSIQKVLKFEQPLIGEDKKPIMENGEAKKKVQVVPVEKLEQIETLLAGQIIRDEIFLFHPKEKANTKKRRLFVAKKIGIITPTATMIVTEDWPNAIGRQVIVTTGWNVWADKGTGETKRNVKVEWDGYEVAPQEDNPDSDLDHATDPVDASFDTDEFDGI